MKNVVSAVGARLATKDFMGSLLSERNNIFGCLYRWKQIFRTTGFAPQAFRGLRGRALRERGY